MVGIIAGVVAVMALVASGLTGLMLALPGAARAMAALAAAYIVWLAWRIATAPPLGDQASARPPSMLAGFLLALANPKAYAAMAALFSGFVLIGERPGLDVLLKALLLVGIMAAVDLAWLLAGSALTRRLREPILNRASPSRCSSWPRSGSRCCFDQPSYVTRQIRPWTPGHACMGP